MKFQREKTVAVILSLLMLAGLASCKTPAIPASPPAAPSASVYAPATLTPSSGAPSTPPPSSFEAGISPGSEESATTESGVDAESDIAAAAVPTGPVEIERLIVELQSREVLKGTILDPNVIIMPDNAADKSYTLSTDDNSVLRQVYGFWTAVGGGAAQLIATAANGVTGSVTVTVIVPLESISLSAKEITLNRGDSVTLAPIFTPADTTETSVIYTSGDERVASVSGDGTVLAVNAGTTVIWCTIGSFSASCTITVVVPTTGISMSTDKRIYKVGDRGSFTVQINPQDATNKTFTAETGSAAITLTDTNTFSCDTSGEATITVTAANGMTASQTVTVIDLAAYANEVLRLTNIERTNAGLDTFSTLPELTRTAAVRANETIQYFSHDRPDGSECFTAFDENGVSYTMAGENIAMGQRTPSEVVRAWMDSEGHRENILNGDFSHLGVGVAMDSYGKLYWSQSFTD